MKCINNEITQKYIDREASPKEIAWVEQHIATCEVCAGKLMTVQKRASKINMVLDSMVDNGISIPEFKPIDDVKTKHFISRKKIIFSIAAACIVLFVIIVPHSKNSDSNKQITIFYSIDQEVDANQPITKQEMVINIIDENGNVSEYVD
jgi:predicted Rossmann fold nucleotide-binding protein DprA/Smf involved in DNA uptake